MRGVMSVHQYLRAGDILLGNRALCSFAHFAVLSAAGVFGCFRLHHRRKDLRPGVQRWTKPQTCPVWMTAAQFARLPKSIEVRLVRYVVAHRGFRTQEVFVATTLMDEKLWPDQAIAQMYAGSEKGSDRKRGQDRKRGHKPLSPFLVRGRPTGRKELSIPRCLAVVVALRGSPYGLPRSRERRRAASSASVCGWLIHCTQFRDISTGHVASNGCSGDSRSPRVQAEHQRQRSARSVRFARRAFRSTYRQTVRKCPS